MKVIDLIVLFIIFNDKSGFLFCKILKQTAARIKNWFPSQACQGESNDFPFNDFPTGEYCGEYFISLKLSLQKKFKINCFIFLNLKNKNFIKSRLIQYKNVWKFMNIFI